MHLQSKSRIVLTIVVGCCEGGLVGALVGLRLGACRAKANWFIVIVSVIVLIQRDIRQRAMQNQSELLTSVVGFCEGCLVGTSVGFRLGACNVMKAFMSVIVPDQSSHR